MECGKKCARGTEKCCVLEHGLTSLNLSKSNTSLYSLKMISQRIVWLLALIELVC